MSWKRFGALVLVSLLMAGLPRAEAYHRRPARKARAAAAKPAPAPGKLVIRSASALVLDQRTGETLVEKSPGAVMPIASITKLMTAMVVLDARQDPREELTIQKDDKDALRHSHSHLPVGTRLTREEALVLALMASENRAAHALARAYPGGMQAAVSAMNAKAKAMELKDTHFEDPTGLDESNVSSARDLAKLVDAAYRYPRIRDYTTRSEATVHRGRWAIAFHNTNALVRNSNWVIGLSKTGFIQEAGRCLVMQAQLAARPVLIILLDSWGTLTRVGDANRIKRWMEAGLAGH